MLLTMIQVRVLAFGVLKDALGTDASEAVLCEGATVSDLVAHLSRNYPHAMLRGIAVSVNAEYASATHVLCQGDEVGLLPPVSGGGAPRTADAQEEVQPRPDVVTYLTREPIDADELVAEGRLPQARRRTSGRDQTPAEWEVSARLSRNASAGARRVPR